MKTSVEYLAYLMTILEDDTLSDKEKECICFVIDEIIQDNADNAAENDPT